MILDDLIQNAGPSFQRRFADEPLLERLRLIVGEPVTDAEVKQKCNSLYRQWAVSYKNVQGMEEVAHLYKQLPQRKRAKPKLDEGYQQTHAQADPFGEEEQSQRERSRSLGNQTMYSRESGQSTFPTSSEGSFLSSASPTETKKDKRSSKEKVKPFRFEKERPQITHVLTMSNIEATGLMNALKLLDKEKERVSSKPAIRQKYDACKALHRQTLRYCNLVTDESYLGALLQANDQVAEATRLYEQLDRSFDYDSDSEDYNTPAGTSAKGKAPMSPTSPGTPSSPTTRQRMASLSLVGAGSPTSPIRPPAGASFSNDRIPDARGKAKRKPPSFDQEDEEDENDPFADSNEVQ